MYRKELYAKPQIDEKIEFIKKQYNMPTLKTYGLVRDLTQSGGTQGAEGGSGKAKCSGPGCLSDRRAKENIVQVGVHPLGVGLYLFDYKPNYRGEYGFGRQFGVMADEIECVIPDAVSVHPDGYKMVNYAMLGITQHRH